ncbi:Invertase, partial [Lachnellula suecica]
MFLSVVLALAAIAAAASSNSSTSIATATVFDSGVSTDAPIPGDYTGSWRPQVHFSPPKDFMNDPNGCFVDADGTWHLYYQYNPTDTVAGNQHWGHATSSDLYHWENQKIAIFATENSQIFSGSVVIDVNNTSGFFPGQTNGVVAMYTLNTAYTQTQEIAYSFDGGYTFEQYSGNPVIASNSNQFRDPKVIRYDDHWVMVLAYAQEFTIGIFTSPDLIAWTHASNFTHQGLLGLQYECPNLVSMPVLGSSDPMYLMAISINPGAPLGGSITQYFPGFFNGTHFTAVDNAARIADFGKDNYAGQFFYGIPETEEQVFIAWASNWQYSQQVPTGEKEGWRSAMSVPRKIYLANVTRTGWDMISAPYNLESIIDNSLASKPDLGNGSVLLDYSTVSSGALYFQANISNIPNGTYSQGTINFTFSASSTRESVSGGFFLGGDNPFWLSRRNILGFAETNPFFTDKFSVGNPINSNGTFTLEGVIDRSILEVFLDGGRNSAIMTFYPEGELDTMELRTGGLDEGVQ